MFFTSFDIPQGVLDVMNSKFYWFDYFQITLNYICVVTPSDRPKSVRNCCLIEVVGGIFML